MTARSGGVLAGLALALAGALTSAEASAYCRSRTCKDTLTKTCEYDGICIVEGKELFRRSSCTSYAVHELGSPTHEISARQMDRLVQEAFDRWLTVDCGDGRPPSLQVVSLGAVACDEVSYNSDSGNVGVFVFRDDWDDPDVSNAYALTTSWYEKKNGEIYDVDVEINATVPELLTSEPEDGIDLPSILTHEIGHFLGLAHSVEPGSVMDPHYTPGFDNLRVLGEDDIAGICAVYPPDRKTSTNRCAPRHGFARNCEFESLDAGGGCTHPSGPAPSTGTALGAVGFLMLIARVRRGRRGRAGA